MFVIGRIWAETTEVGSLARGRCIPLSFVGVIVAVGGRVCIVNCCRKITIIVFVSMLCLFAPCETFVCSPELNLHATGVG